MCVSWIRKANTLNFIRTFAADFEKGMTTEGFHILPTREKD